MADIRLITWNEHAGKRWFKPTDFRFAAHDRMAGLCLSELPKAMLSLPLGLAKLDDSSYTAVCVQGLLPGQNLLVNAAGQWLADYVPIMYRTMPFKVARNTEGNYVLCADHGSGLVTDTPAGFQFYEAENKLSSDANAVTSLLMQFEAERPRMQLICQMLDKHGLIEPWPLQLQQGEALLNVEGLYRINERRLMELAGEALVEVRDTGGLMVSYAQLFSMQHMQQLGAVAQRTHWANRVSDQQAHKVAGLNIVDDNGILSFAKL